MFHLICLPVLDVMDNTAPTPSVSHHHHHHYHHHLSFPTVASLIRLLPLSLLLFLTTPHRLVEHIHAIYTRRPYLKPSPLDPFPSQHGDVNVDVLPLPLHVPLQRDSVILRPGTSFYASLSPPEECMEKHPCSALLETWYDSSLPRESKPDPYFLAANGDVPQPFPRFPVARLADDEAFFTWRPYHYLQLAHVVASDRWHVRILNHDSTVFNVLNASFRVTVVPSEARLANEKTKFDMTDAKSSLCPNGPGSAPCSSHGKCVKGECKCMKNFGGRYCETNVTDLPTGVFEVEPDSMRVFRFVAPRYGPVATVLRLQAPQTVSSAAHPILFAKRLGDNGGRQLRVGPPLPSIYDLRFTDVPAVHAHLSLQHVITSKMREGEVLYIGVYNFHATAPAWLARRHRAVRLNAASARRHRVRVSVDSFSCVERVGQQTFQPGEVDKHSDGENGIRVCPPRSAQTWEVSLRFLLGPLVLGSLTLMTMVVCVSVWAGVFRQQMLDTMTSNLEGSNNGLAFQVYSLPRRDKLSEIEVNAMFPAFEFTKGETDALCAVGDASCSVCLCSFEEKEMLRRLACGHSYHSECLDRWLLTNATCPRCRKSARIRVERLASGGVLFLRRAVRWSSSQIDGFTRWVLSLSNGGARERGVDRSRRTADSEDRGSRENGRHVVETRGLIADGGDISSRGNEDPTNQV